MTKFALYISLPFFGNNSAHRKYGKKYFFYLWKIKTLHNSGTNYFLWCIFCYIFRAKYIQKLHFKEILNSGSSWKRKMFNHHCELHSKYLRNKIFSAIHQKQKRVLSPFFWSEVDISQITSATLTVTDIEMKQSADNVADNLQTVLVSLKLPRYFYVGATQTNI